MAFSGGWFEDNDDPLKAGRCRIRIVGIHSPIKKKDFLEGAPTENLIWAEPASPIFGGISGVGICGVPCQGAHVFCFFENGNIMQPRYFATAPGIPRIPANPAVGFRDSNTLPEKQSYPLEFGGEPDWFWGQEKTANYTDSMVIRDKAGNRIEFDSTKGKEKIIIAVGKSGAKQVFGIDGSITSNAGNSTAKTRVGQQQIVVSGDSSEIVGGKRTRSSGMSKDSVLGDKSEYIAGKSDHAVTALERRKSGGLEWNVEGDTTINTGGEAVHISDGDTLIKSNKQNIKMIAKMINIEMEAKLGQIKGESMTIDLSATLTATLKGMISSTLGSSSCVTTNVEGLTTTIKGTSMVMITGGVIMIG